MLKKRRYKCGYEVREEMFNGHLMKTAYTHDGKYIGSPKIAHYICKKKGIKPELKPNCNVCSIGFSEKDQKWYGWSHRAIYGFGIGSVVKMGDCGFLPSCKEEQLQHMKDFWLRVDSVVMREEYDVPDPHKDIRSHSPNDERIGVLVELSHGSKLSSIYWEPYPEAWGRGVWTAKTLEDAKQMAIDFSDGVS